MIKDLPRAHPANYESKDFATMTSICIIWTVMP